jgi:methyl-accepting chemotaxis protein
MLVRVKIWMKVGGGFAIIIALMVAVTLIAYNQNLTVSKIVDGSGDLTIINAAGQDMVQRVVEILQAQNSQGGYGLQGSSGNLKDVADQVSTVTTRVGELQAEHPLNDSQVQRLKKIGDDAGTFRSDYMSYWVERGNEARYASDWNEAVGRLQQSAGQGSGLSDLFSQLQITALVFLKDKQPIQWEAYSNAMGGFGSVADRLASGGRGAELGKLLRSALDDYGAAMGNYKTYFQKEAEAAVRMTQTAQEINTFSQDLMNEFMMLAKDSFNAAIRLMFIALGIAVLAGIFIALLITRGITRPMTRAVSFASTIAEGDLTQRLGIRQHDEVGLLAETLDRMAARLGEMVVTIQDSAEQVAASSEEISASSVSLTEGAQSQASTLEETSASVEELTASIEQVSSHAQSQASAFEQGSGSMAQVQTSIEEITTNLGQIAELARQSLERSQQGGQSVDQVVEAITLISQSSEKIGGIVTVISEIAIQTNLLALNASIEAARAGEYGRGFAVVADEVSKLADRSATSAKEIAALIKESAKNVTRGVERARGSKESMEQTKESARLTSDKISTVSAAMQQQLAGVRELASALGNISEMSQSISAATEEQTASAKEVSKAVETVNDLTQHAAASTEQISSAAEQLSGMAAQLQNLTTTFKVSRDGHGVANGEVTVNGSGTVNGDEQLNGNAEGLVLANGNGGASRTATANGRAAIGNGSLNGNQNGSSSAEAARVNGSADSHNGEAPASSAEEKTAATPGSREPSSSRS